MKGYKDSTKTQYLRGGPVKAEAKIGKVMGEFKAGTLHSGSSKGPKVANRKQAVAIAMSEARKAGAKLPMKKAEGGPVENKTGTRRDPEYGDFVIAGQAQKPAPRARRVPPASTTPRVQQPPRSRAMFGDEAAAAHVRGGEEAMRAAEKREGFKAGGGVSTTGKRLMKKYGSPGC